MAKINSLKHFKHTRLSTDRPSAIRLLKVESAVEYDSELRCLLDVVDLDDAKRRQYEALSWCWGDREDDVDIVLTGGAGPDHLADESERFPVRKPLVEALKALRLPDKSRWLWVDYICIDQSNEEERNAQVARMSEIYGEAFNVCIWLGSDHADGEKGLLFVKHFSSHPYLLEEYCTDETYLSNWIAFRDLLERPWFSRRWIVQEVALSLKATVHCGRQQVSWEDFKSAVSILAQSRGTAEKLDAMEKQGQTTSGRKTPFSEVSTLGAAKLTEICERLFKRNSQNILLRTSTLEDLVALLPDFETHEPRDTIYALLALAKDTRPHRDTVPDYLYGRRVTNAQRSVLRSLKKLFPTVAEETFRVDYEQPVVDIYQQFIAYALKRADPTRALDVICRPFAKAYTIDDDNNSKKTTNTETHSSHIPLPSWMPDRARMPYLKRRVQAQRTANLAFTTHRYIRERGDLFASGPFTNSMYNAAESRKYDVNEVCFRRRRDHFSMYVEGFVLDVIESATDTSSRGSVTQQWIRLGRNDDAEDKLKDFLRTLIADRGPQGPAPAFYISTLRQVLEQFQDGTLLPDHEMNQTKSTLVVEVMEHLINTISGRRLIKTKRFKLLGLVPDEAQVGDLVCILNGCSVPVILRRGKNKKNHDADQSDDEVDLIRRRIQSSRRLKSWLNRPRSLDEQQPGAVLDAVEADAEILKRDSASPPTNARAGLDSASHRSAVSPVALNVQTTKDAEATSKVLLPRFRDWICVLKICMLSLLAGLGSYVFEDNVLGCTVMLLCTPHFLFELLNPGHDHGRLSRLLSLLPAIMVSMLYSLHSFHRAVVVWLVVTALYPELFPSRWGTTLSALLLTLVRYQATAVDEAANTAQSSKVEVVESKGVGASPLSPTHSGNHFGRSIRMTKLGQRATTMADSAGLPDKLRDLRQPKTLRDMKKTNDPGYSRKDEMTDKYPFRLIGESYIDGMMTGEAVRKQSESIETGDRMYTVKFELR